MCVCLCVLFLLLLLLESANKGSDKSETGVAFDCLSYKQVLRSKLRKESLLFSSVAPLCQAPCFKKKLRWKTERRDGHPLGDMKLFAFLKRPTISSYEPWPLSVVSFGSLIQPCCWGVDILREKQKALVQSTLNSADQVHCAFLHMYVELDLHVSRRGGGHIQYLQLYENTTVLSFVRKFQ